MARRRLVLVGCGLVVAGLAAGVYWFEPQAKFLDDRVDEAVPVAASDDARRQEPRTESETESESESETENPLLRSGRFVGVAGHDFEGGAQLLQVGAAQYLRFEDLRGDNGPDLVVYLSSAPADGDPDALDDDVIDLGGLKGNIGSSNYQVPAGTDLERYGTAVIWCRRFSVGFAVADLGSETRA